MCDVLWWLGGHSQSKGNKPPSLRATPYPVLSCELIYLVRLLSANPWAGWLRLSLQSYLKDGLLLLFFAVTGSGFEYFGEARFGRATVRGCCA